MRATRRSPCKINLLLNILGRRPDGFHDLETLFLPLALADQLEFEPASDGIALTCDHPDVPLGGGNLVVRAAEGFFAATGLAAGVRIHLTKRIPMAAGLGGGSSNAAITLRALNDLFDHPLPASRLGEIAAQLGSDVPFFLQDQPALATGRGEQLRPVGSLPVLEALEVLLIHPGFGISTPWAYGRMAHYPEALRGQPGRATRLVNLLRTGQLEAGLAECYNSLEAPAFDKYPILPLYQTFLRAEGALATLMSGSGSTTFALFEKGGAAREAQARFKQRFGEAGWTAVVRVQSPPAPA